MGLLSPGKLLIILAIVLIIVGPGKLPQAAKGIGQMFKNVRKEVNEDDED